MIIAEKGIVPNITLWRGDITAATFDLRLVNKTSETVTLFQGLTDQTPARHTIKLVPPYEAWLSLPSGEYEYYIENEGITLAVGLLQNIENKESYEYNTDNIFTEYRA